MAVVVSSSSSGGGAPAATPIAAPSAVVEQAQVWRVGSIWVTPEEVLTTPPSLREGV